MGIQKITNRNIISWFYGIMGVLITLFLLGLIIFPLGNQLNVFFLKTNNLFADFFNVQIYIADWDPYHNTVNGLGEKCYMPFTYLILEIFNGFFNYSGANLSDCYGSSTAMMSCVLFMVVQLFLFYHSMNCLGTISSTLKFILLLSSVVLFSVERGNVIVLCAALICYFLAFKNSKEKWLRLFALLCLCVVSIIKIYPVLLGLYLLKDKRYKDIAICVCLSLVLAFVPFLFFKGQFGNITQIINNLSVFSESYSPYRIFPRFGLTHIFAWGMVGLNVDKSVSDIILLIPKIFVFMAFLMSLGLFFYEKNSWKRMALLSLPLIMLPTNSAFYCGLYFIPVILFFLKNNEGRSLDFAYMLLFCVFLNPFQLPVIKGINISQFFANVALLLIWLLLLLETAAQLKQQRRSIS